MNMTPQEISDYRHKWMSNGGYAVKTHSDYEYDAKKWCRDNLNPGAWHFQKYTNVYEHTFFFEKEEDARNFVSQWEYAEFVE